MANALSRQKSRCCVFLYFLEKGEHTMGEFASKGVAGAGLGTGIAGLSLGVLNAMGGCGVLGNLFNGNRCCEGDVAVNRYELNLIQEISSKDARIGLLEADKYTDQKIVEAYKDLQGQITAIKDAQTAINTQQAVYNGTNTAAIACMQSQIAQLLSLTKLVVPNASVCPGWGNVTITPATTTTTPAA